MPENSTTVSYRFDKYSLNDAEKGLIYYSNTVVQSAPFPDTTLTYLDTSEYRIFDECTKMPLKSINANDTTAQILDISTLTNTIFDFESTYIDSDTYEYRFNLSK